MYGLEGSDMEPSMEEIERVAKLANADVFIEVNRAWVFCWMDYCGGMLTLFLALFLRRKCRKSMKRK